MLIRCFLGWFLYGDSGRALNEVHCFALFFKPATLFHMLKDELHYILFLALEYNEAAAEIVHRKHERRHKQL